MIGVDLPGCGLWLQVHGSLDHLRIRLQNEGFRRLDQASEKYLVTLCAPMEYKVRLTSDLKFISLSLRTVRWLSGSLVFEREESKAHDQISSDSMSQQHRPNCVRFIIRNGRQVIEEGELRVRVRRHPVLEFDSSGSTGGEGIRVGAAFHGMVSFVRKVRKEIWLSRKDCLIVKLLDVTEWEGRTRGKNHFKSQKTRQEVELHMLDASAHLGGSDMAFEIFITRFWNSALRFKEAIF
ncbi:hypothetical protein Mapa_004767 [Marchantia paleacea]|nr:hypothetical protein Mapa_004767 [Marchantia paleacea]